MANTNTKYELIKNTVDVWKAMIENKITTKMSCILFVSNKNNPIGIDKPKTTPLVFLNLLLNK